MPKPTREQIEQIQRQCLSDGELKDGRERIQFEADQETVLGILSLALLSLTAMEGEGVEVPELWTEALLELFERNAGHPDNAQPGAAKQIRALQDFIRRNNAEPVLRALVAKLEAELKEATIDQPTMAGLTTVMDERDAALKLVKELSEGLEKYGRHPYEICGRFDVYEKPDCKCGLDALVAKSQGVK